MSTLIKSFLALSFLILSACSGSSDSSKGKFAEGPTSDLNTKSCDFSVSQGGQADFALLGQRELHKMLFDKPINVKYLDAIAKANVESSIQFINQTGTTVYKGDAINTKHCSQPLFAQAAVAPKDVSDIWKIATEGDGEKTGYTLGIYLPKLHNPSLPSLRNSAMIVVRENTNRWTLVHEFMHHLFQLGAVDTGYDEQKTLLDLERATNDMDVILKNGFSAENATQLAEAYVRFAKALDSKLVDKTLEEMTIEAEMKNAYNAGALEFLPLSSNFYINSNGEKALKTYDNIEPLGESLRNYLSAPEHAILRADIQEVLDLIAARRNTISSVLTNYPLKNLKDFLPGITAQEEFTSGCAHAHEADEILQQSQILQKFNRKLQETGY